MNKKVTVYLHFDGDDDFVGFHSGIVNMNDSEWTQIDLLNLFIGAAGRVMEDIKIGDSKFALEQAEGAVLWLKEKLNA